MLGSMRLASPCGGSGLIEGCTCLSILNTNRLWETRLLPLRSLLLLSQQCLSRDRGAYVSAVPQADGVPDVLTLSEPWELGDRGLCSRSHGDSYLFSSHCSMASPFTGDLT